MVFCVLCVACFFFRVRIFFVFGGMERGGGGRGGGYSPTSAFVITPAQYGYADILLRFWGGGSVGVGLGHNSGEENAVREASTVGWGHGGLKY